MNALDAIPVAACIALAAQTASAQYYQSQLASNHDEQSFSIDQTQDGGFVTAGYRQVHNPGPLFNDDFYIAKHDKNGNLQWLRVWDLSDIGIFITCFNAGCP